MEPSPVASLLMQSFHPPNAAAMSTPVTSGDATGTPLKRDQSQAPVSTESPGNSDDSGYGKDTIAASASPTLSSGRHAGRAISRPKFSLRCMILCVRLSSLSPQR